MSLRLAGLTILLAACSAAMPCRADIAENAFFKYLRSDGAAMVAFNPSHFDPRQPFAADRDLSANIRADLASLRPYFDGLVLYATQPELTPMIVVEAKGQGFRAVLFGIWDPKSETEIASAIALIAAHCRQLACAVVIGNEGINDNRYDLRDVERAARTVRSRLPKDMAIPLTTSEPSADYGWPPLREFGDFLAPNIHPAIDQTGRDPAEAGGWVRTRATAIARAARKPVVVKETGLPNGGAPSFTPDRQRAFWAAYLGRGRLERLAPPDTWISYGVAFEAFDAPWKAEVLHDPIEGRWGLLSVARDPYPALAVWRR